MSEQPEPTRPRRTEDLAARGIYGLGWFLARRLPERAALALARSTADRSAARKGPRVQGLEANLRRVVGPDIPQAELDVLVRDGMRSYLRYWCEVFRLPSWSNELVRERCQVEGFEHIVAAHERGQGVVIALPHCANWDLAGAWIAGQGLPFVTVAEKLRPDAIFRRFVAHRESLGMEVLPLDEGEGASVFGALLRHVRAGGVVCLPADRDLTESGVEVKFFGETARMPGGAAALAVSTGAALFAIELWYDDDVMRIRVPAPLEIPLDGDRRSRVATLMQQIADAFETGIARHPEDWHVTQPVWVADMDDDPVSVPAAGSR
jgi:lauroyl/myristoyl acyltransferase